MGVDIVKGVSLSVKGESYLPRMTLGLDCFMEVKYSLQPEKCGAAHWWG